MAGFDQELSYTAPRQQNSVFSKADILHSDPTEATVPGKGSARSGSSAFSAEVERYEPGVATITPTLTIAREDHAFRAASRY